MAAEYRSPEWQSWMRTGIYTITSPSGKKYVGSASDFKERWGKHRFDLKNGKHPSPYLQNAWNKYGEDGMVFEKLIFCTKNDLVLYEQIAMDSLMPEYNLIKVAASSLGYRHTEETKAKMRARKRRSLTEAEKAHLSSINKGKKMGAEHSLKVSQGLKGKKKTPEHCLAMSIAKKGQRKGIKFTDEHRENLKKAWEVRREKLRDSNELA